MTLSPRRTCRHGGPAATPGAVVDAPRTARAAGPHVAASRPGADTPPRARRPAPGLRATVAALVGLALLGAPAAAQQATVTVAGSGVPLVLEHDDTRVTESCVVMVPVGTVIEDSNGDGVLHIAADGITVSFTDASVLRGAAPDVLPDAYAGFGVVVDGHRDVTLRGLRVRGFQTAVLARDADGLRVEECELVDNFRQRLRSTAEAADDGSDWLAPHDNDAQQWRRRYGAALCVENSAGVEIHNLFVRDTQNGVILDRVVDSEVVGCDLSFLSGWGLALWRSSRNVIGRNALDFCVRGYSHGVYNRGQDSAGLLLFEQCHDNLIALNSITHGGDGIFAFSGREALGEAAADDDEGAPADDGLDRAGIGHHGNAFLENDLSFAAAHGLELTFAEANLIRGNRFEGNAICGIWGGYSRGLRITGNSFQANGDAGYGAERGGVNIEHGRDDAIVANLFRDNACGVHLWWDEDAHLASLPWALANGTGCAGNVIADNRFEGDAVAVQLRACEPTLLRDNQFVDVGTEVSGEPGATTADGALPPEPALSAEHAAAYTRLRQTRWGVGGLGRPEPRGPRRRPWLDWSTWQDGGAGPVGSRPELRGRQHIVMGEWGPWDHEGTLLRVGARRGASHRIDVFGRRPGAGVTCTGNGLHFELTDDAVTVRPAPGARGVLPYRVAVEGLGALEGRLVAATWDLTVFPWTVDPREDLAGWRAQSGGPEALRTTVDQLLLPYGGGGPSQLDLGAEIAAAALPAERFGTLARTRLPLTAGTWQVTTVSDDGVRVTADGLPVIDNWTWHAPTTDTGTFTVHADGEVLLTVEHFELDGWATLELRLAPVE